MRNPLLSNFSRSDAMFRAAGYLPVFIRDRMISSYVDAARRRIERRSFPDRLTLFLTDQCNLRCEHCFIVKGQPKTWEMGLAEYEQLFASLDGRVAQLLVTGGEPTIRSEFADIILLADEVGKVGTVGIFTNGLKWQRLAEILERLLSQSRVCLNIQTSIDGLSNFHDRHRRMEGAFSKTLEMIAMVSGFHRRHPKRIGRVVVTTSISRANLDSLREIVRLTRESGALPAFTFVRGSNHGVRKIKDSADISTFEPDNYGDYLTSAEMQRAIDVLTDELWSRDPANLLFAYNRTTLQTIAYSLEQEVGQVDCRMGWADLVILHNGDVARCEMLKSFASLADFDWNLERLLKSPLFTEYMRRTSGCWCTHDCGVGVSIMYEPRLISHLFENPGRQYPGLLVQPPTK